MEELAVDLHIHSHHSISVSKKMTIPNIALGAREKGLDIMGTGDATQPEWLAHLRKALKSDEEGLSYDGVSFIISAEIEDTESIHHVILLPDFDSVDTLRALFKPHSPNIDHEWGGRPRVNLRGEEIAGFVRDVGGLIGPAHAFTPFRSIFREGRHDSLTGCYGSEARFISFIELGLSADTEMADCISELRQLTFITSSDAHSPSPGKLGREFVKFRMESSTFLELKRAILREKGRTSVLNVGLNPRLGKYYLSFCPSCRRTLLVEKGGSSPSFDNLNIYMSCENEHEELALLKGIHSRSVSCPSDGKALRLGVRDRAFMIGDGASKSPSHRPPYMDLPPLLDLITSSLGIKSSSSKRVRCLYDEMRRNFGSEINILTETPIEHLSESDSSVATMIEAYRTKSVGYIPGGGGRYGRLVAPWSDEES